jgi:hypothetical protein
MEAAQAYLLTTVDHRVAHLNERMKGVCAQFGRVYVEYKVCAFCLAIYACLLLQESKESIAHLQSSQVVSDLVATKYKRQVQELLLHQSRLLNERMNAEYYDRKLDAVAAELASTKRAVRLTRASQSVYVCS